MSNERLVVLLPLLAGLAMPLGAWFARIENLRPHWLEQEFRHSVIAFGGGALLSAIALVLVPEGTAELSMAPALVCFLAGGLAFMALDVRLAKSNSPAGQLVAMISDFVPEAMALGAAFAVGGSGGVLLALLIALQNLPEGFNAYRELMADGKLAPGRVLWSFVGMALLGPLAALLGFHVLASQPVVVACIMLFAAGGILYLVFQDIAPQARLEKHWSPPLGAVLGFALGLAGKLLTG